MRKIFIVLLFALVFSGCVSSGVRELTSVEVREYKGEKLSSFSDFRENSIRGVQQINISEYKLEINGLVENPQSLTYEEVLSNQKYSKVVRLYCVEGWDVNILWEGVLLNDLFEKANPKPEANTVIFRASDGYSTSLPLSYIIDNDIIIAYKINNVTLPPANGFPFHLVAEDKYGYKWVRWITKIELSDNPDYRGTWESGGYNQKADVGGPIFEPR